MRLIKSDKITNMYMKLKDEVILSIERESDSTYDSSYMLFSKYQIPEQDEKDLNKIRDKLESAFIHNKNDIKNLTSQRNELLARHCKKVEDALTAKFEIEKNLNYYLYVLIDINISLKICFMHLGRFKKY